MIFAIKQVNKLRHEMWLDNLLTLTFIKNNHRGNRTKCFVVLKI